MVADGPEKFLAQLEGLAAEWAGQATVLGHSPTGAWRPDPGHALGASLWGHPLATPLGVNVAASEPDGCKVIGAWLQGVRVFEGGPVTLGILLGLLRRWQVLGGDKAAATLWLARLAPEAVLERDDLPAAWAAELAPYLRVLPADLGAIDHSDAVPRGVVLVAPDGSGLAALRAAGTRLLEAGLPTHVCAGAAAPWSSADFDAMIRDLLTVRERLGNVTPLGVRILGPEVRDPVGYKAAIGRLVGLRMAFGGNLPVSFEGDLSPDEFPAALALGLAPVVVPVALAADLSGHFAAAARAMDGLGVTLREELVHAQSGGCADRAMCLVGNAAEYLEGLGRGGAA